MAYYPTFHTFTFPSSSASSFKNLVLHRYQLAMPRLSRGIHVDTGVYVATSVNPQFLKYHMK